MDSEDEFDFHSFFDKHLDEVKISVLSNIDLKHGDLHNCYIVANRLELLGFEPKKAMEESVKYYVLFPGSEKDIDKIVLDISKDKKYK